MRDELAYSANHTYREGYDDGFADGKEIKLHEQSEIILRFIGQCGKMADENWAHSHAEMLRRLFGAVISGEKYDEWEG